MPRRWKGKMLVNGDIVNRIDSSFFSNRVVRRNENYSYLSIRTLLHWSTTEAVTSQKVVQSAGYATHSNLCVLMQMARREKLIRIQLAIKKLSLGVRKAICFRTLSLSPRWFTKNVIGRCIFYICHTNLMVSFSLSTMCLYVNFSAWSAVRWKYRVCISVRLCVYLFTHFRSTIPHNCHLRIFLVS